MVSAFGTNSAHQFHCNSRPLEIVEDYKYLGMWIPKKRIFKKTYIILAVNLRKCLIKLQTPPVSVALHLFNYIIKPILCYVYEILGFTV